MLQTSLPDLYYHGEKLDAEQADWMADSSPLLDDFDALRQRMDADGYLYLPGLLGRDRVRAARRCLTDRLAGLGLLDPSRDPMEAIPSATYQANFAGGRLEQLFPDPKPIRDVLYDGPMMGFFRQFLQSPVRHFDFTWMRQVAPGPSTHFHSDVVYMGRGTHQLYTAWTPMGDNGFDLGGLLALAGSHRHDGFKKAYWQSDVDAYCENTDDHRDGWARTGGWLKGSPEQLHRSIGGKWVTSDYRMGDVVIFNVYTVHGGTDNRSNALRLSTDTRYQNAADAIDERWIGDEPPAHGPNAKKGVIC